MIRAFLSVVAAVVLAAGPAQAQSYPARPIRIAVPFSPGGPTDMISRIIGQRMQSILGQTIFVENRLGAGGTIGTRAVVAADPDGYTLLVGNTATLVIRAGSPAEFAGFLCQEREKWGSVARHANIKVE
jgi:tripartite-type tricarboxylate transporter receptor subunit TctC